LKRQFKMIKKGNIKCASCALTVLLFLSTNKNHKNNNNKNSSLLFTEIKLAENLKSDLIDGTWFI